MRILRWQVFLGLGLIALSAMLYALHYAMFRDSHHIFIYLIGDIAFVPIEVLLVTLIIHRLLSQREKQGMLDKMNMVIGAFFSAAGTGLLKKLSGFSPKPSCMDKNLIATAGWSEKDFKNASTCVKDIDHGLDSKRADLAELRDFLSDRQDFMLRLLENPTLLEHDSFTDLLWAVFHLTEELQARENLNDLPASDLEHLTGDMKRVYSQLISEWLAYLKHLKGAYPFLYSLAVRTNPLNPEASPVIRE
ncbi:MAG: hypothetical protein Q8J64_01885 [Thermodesulfovibrionales bacterium]|nr:hypothetical protein [Thermodesulfovibrionales bacterium]